MTPVSNPFLARLVRQLERNASGLAERTRELTVRFDVHKRRLGLALVADRDPAALRAAALRKETP